MTISAKPNLALKNHLLATLNADDFAPLEPLLEPISFKLGHVLYESGDKSDYAYFPTTAIVSLLYVMANGTTAEIGVIGNDGIIGVSIFMGGETSNNRAVIQSAGQAYRIKARDLQNEFAKGQAFQKLLLRFTQALLTQIAQTAVCNRLHTVEQQLCRWILLSHDRLDSNKLVMTHDLISNMLGVRREGVTLAAQKLSEKGLIKNDRGSITLLDRQGLEANVCECYEVVNAEYNRLLSRGIGRTFG